MFVFDSIVQPYYSHILFACRGQQKSSERGQFSVGLQPHRDASLRHSFITSGVAPLLRTGTLLGLDQPGGALHAHDQTARHFGVQGAAVARLLHPQDPTDPRHHLVGRRVGRLVQVDEAASGGVNNSVNH